MHGINDFLKSFIIRCFYDCEHGISIKQPALEKYLNLACICNYSKKKRNVQNTQHLGEWGVPAETAEVAIQLHGLLAKFYRLKKQRAGDVLKVTPFVTEGVPEQRGSYTFLSLQGKTTTTTSRVYCSVPTVSVPAMEHFQTTTVKHLERLSRRKKKYYKNHTTKIYSRNVFPKLTLCSQNFWGPKAILGTFASWCCSLTLCFNFTLFYVFMGKECFIRCPQNFFIFVWLV